MIDQANNTTIIANITSEQHLNKLEENDEEYQKSLEFVFEVLFLSIVGLIGIFGNALLLCVFSRQHLVLKFHKLMMMLASYDLMYILLSLMLFTIPQVSPNYKASGAHFHILPKALPLAQIALTGSIYSTLAITIERYLTVCHPFYSISHNWSAKRYIIPIVIFSLLYNMPKFFELETGYLDPNNTTSPYNFTIEPTSMRVNEVYIKVYCIWMNFIFMGLGPFCLLIALNLLTLRSLVVHSQTTQSHQISQSKKNEIALAKVSLTIVFVFILCHSVKWIPNLYELARLAREDKREWPPWVESTTHISHFLMTFNSSVNFYIYCIKHYNLISRLLCCCSRARSENDVQSTILLQENNSIHFHGENGHQKNQEAHSSLKRKQSDMAF